MRACAATADWELGPDGGGSKLQMENERSAGGRLSAERLNMGCSSKNKPPKQARARRERTPLACSVRASSEREQPAVYASLLSVSVHCCPPAVHHPLRVPLFLTTTTAASLSPLLQ